MNIPDIVVMVENFLSPIISSALQKVGLGPSASAVVTSDITKTIANDPVAINQMNLEPLHQSRVVQGSVVALLVGIATAIYGWSAGDNATMTSGLSAAVAAGWALYGRIANGLAPVGTPAVKVISTPVSTTGIAPAGASVAKVK